MQMCRLMNFVKLVKLMIRGPHCILGSPKRPQRALRLIDNSSFSSSLSPEACVLLLSFLSLIYWIDFHC